MPKPEELILGELRMAATGGSYRLRCSQLAVEYETDTLVLASVVGPQTAVGAFTAILNTNQNADFYQDDLELKRIWSYQKLRKPSAKGGQYAVRSARLGFNTVHSTVVLKEVGIMPNVTEDSLWAELTSPRFTTPLLRDWVPWLMHMLLDRATNRDERCALRLCECCQCRVGKLLLTSEDLDELVAHGIKKGKLRIPRKDVPTCTS